MTTTPSASIHTNLHAPQVHRGGGGATLEHLYDVMSYESYVQVYAYMSYNRLHKMTRSYFLSLEERSLKWFVLSLLVHALQLLIHALQLPCLHLTFQLQLLTALLQLLALMPKLLSVFFPRTPVYKQ